MKQLTIGELKKQIELIPDNTPVFFRRIAPLCGNIEQAGIAKLDEYSFFGIVEPCVIIEPQSDDE